MTGVELDEGWVGARLTKVAIHDLSGWHENIATLDEPNRISTALVRRLQRTTQRTLLVLRLS
jgi:hypothetical protein